MKKILILSVFALAACRGGDSKPVDSSLARDLALASQMQAAQPQFQDTAAGTSRNAPAPQRIGNAPRTRVTPRQPVEQAGEDQKGRAHPPVQAYAQKRSSSALTKSR